MATALRQTLKDSLLGCSNSKSLIDDTHLPLKRVILKRFLFFVKIMSLLVLVKFLLVFFMMS